MPESSGDGRFPPESDLVGLWLRSALVGKRTYYVTRAGDTKRLDETDLAVPGTYNVKYDSNSGSDLLTDDVYEIKVHWDQWVEVTLECAHGTFIGESEFFNFTEALIRAAEEFNAADHPDAAKAPIFDMPGMRGIKE